MAAEVDAALCSVCQEIYRDPRVLQCGHSFCLECIKGVADSMNKFPCPICRLSVNLRDGNVDQLPKNFGLSNIIETKDKTHPSMCFKHKKLLDIFCDGCDMVICSKCLVMQHNGHVIGDMDKIFIERNTQLAVFLDLTKMLASRIEKTRDVVEQSRKSMQKNAGSVKLTVDRLFKKWFDALNTQHNTVLSYVHQERDKKIRIHDEAESILKSSMANVTELETEINKIRSKDAAFVVQARFLRQRKISVIQRENVKLRSEQWKLHERLEELKERDIEQLDYENKILKSLMSDLHEYVTSHTEVNDNPFELPSTIEPDTPVATRYRQAEDIYHEFKERIQSLVSDLESANTANKQLHSDYKKLQNTNQQIQQEYKTLQKEVQDKERVSNLQKKDIEQLDYENMILKTLHSDLHKYTTSHTEVKDNLFELPSTIEPNTPVATQYRQVQDIYYGFKERIQSLVSDLESANTAKKQLQSDCEGLKG